MNLRLLAFIGALMLSGMFAPVSNPNPGTGGDLTAKYVIQQADALLPNAQVLGSLGSGCLSVTTVTGVIASTGSACSSGDVTAKYWIGAADGTLVNAFNLGILTTGLVLNTVAAGTGTPSIYGGAAACTNQVVTAISASGATTCHTIVAADTTGLGTVTSVATTSPLGGGTITTTGTLTCTTCTTNASALTSGTIMIGQGSNTSAVATGTAAAPTINATTGYQLNGTAIRTALALTNTGAYTAINNTTTKTYFAIGTDGLITASPLNTAGTRLEMNFSGVFGALISDTVVISVEICTVSGCGSGTVVALAATAAITPTAETNAGWSTSVTCNVYTTGASGTMDCQGFSLLSTAAGTALVAQMQNTATKTVDLTVNEYVSVAVTWAGVGAPSATDTITLRQFVAKVF